MIFAIINVVTSTLGIVGFFQNIPLLIIIGGMMYLLETFIGLKTGELRSMATTIISSVISIPVSVFNGYSIFLGWCVGLCIESIALSVISVIFMVVVTCIKK